MKIKNHQYEIEAEELASAYPTCWGIKLAGHLIKTPFGELDLIFEICI